MRDRPDDWDAPVALPPGAAPQRILVPFDGSHNAERALAWAAHVAERESSEIIVMVAFEQPLTVRGRGAPLIESIREELEAEAKELAAEAVTALHAQGTAARGLVVKGDVAHAILDTAEAESCELVVIGRRGLTAEVGGVTSALDRVRDMLQGGVADKVIRHCSVPVLVVA
jgi:nucleotide-binding universal stress UspA family protein